MTIYPEHERRQSDQAVQALREEVGQLKDGTLGLAEQVGLLSGALTSIAVLQDKLVEVEAKSVSKDELSAVTEAEHEEALEFRKNALRRIYTTFGFLLLGLLTVAAVVGLRYLAQQERARVECEQRRVTNTAIQQYVTSQRAIELADPRAIPELRQRRVETLDGLAGAFPVPTCEATP